MDGTERRRPSPHRQPRFRSAEAARGLRGARFINRFAEAQKWKQKRSGLKLEWLIHDYFPSDVRSRAKVRDWLIKNWKTYDAAWDQKVARSDVP
ncbi:MULTISPECIES: hypothetical protein [unclassified Lysobacter]|uniref:hypothetical protein n=1 Tax=unclassified Lysobacter TaxID=2635362 RepID=UPI000ADFB88B|nr:MULTISPECIES: hypothetical protein [unclassified Lysobacter]